MVSENTVTTPAELVARTPAVPPLRVIAAARLVALAVTDAPIWKLSPRFRVALAVSTSGGEPVRVMVTVPPAAGRLVNVPVLLANAPELVAPADDDVYTTKSLAQLGVA